MPGSNETQNGKRGENSLNEESKRISVLDRYKQARLEEATKLLKLLEENKKLKEERLKALSLIEPKRKFSFLQRLFTRRKQYRDYTKEYKHSRENIKDLESEISVSDKKLLGNQIAFEDQQKICKKIESAKAFEDLGVTSELAIIQMLSEGIKFKFSSCQEALKLAPGIFSKNPQFMEKAVKEDFELIKYDQTFEKSVYIKALERKVEMLMKKIENNNLDTFVQNHLNAEIAVHNQAIEELKNPKEVKEGKYKIPEKYLFEEIRDTISDEKSIMGYDYIQADGKYSERDGKKLEEIYNSENNLIGIHNTPVSKEIMQNILRDGIRESRRDGRGKNGTLDFSHTVAFNSKKAERVLNFCGVLSYFWNGDAAGSLEERKSVILCIPKRALDLNHPIPIWGSHCKDGEDNYILPQYIVGVIEGAKEDGIKIEYSTHEEETKYEYLKYDSQTAHIGVVTQNENELE